MGNKKLTILAVIVFMAIFAFVGAFAVLLHQVNARAAGDAAAAQARNKALAAASWQAHLRRKAAAWRGHLQREAWDKAHPAEVARRKAGAQARLVQEEAARQEAARRRAEADRVAIAQRAEEDARAAKELHPCETAGSLADEAANALNNDNQKAYDLAVSGFHYAEECDVSEIKTVREGYLLSFKAMAERTLSSGDSRTDINQAITLLAECQTLPGLYGTKGGAGCETQEEYDIRAKMNWDMAEDRY
jgi:type IV secretory pathway VirB10-like protein